MPISLQCALGKPNKEFLNGVATLRNTSMATLARDLIGVQSEFSRLGQITNEDAYTLFLDACRRCSPGGGWDEQEWEQIWNSAVTAFFDVMRYSNNNERTNFLNVEGSLN